MTARDLLLLPVGDHRIVIRWRHAADDAALLASMTNPEMERWTSMPQAPGDRDLRRVFEELAFAVIADRATDTPLGGIGVYRWEPDAGTVELGYWVGAAHRGRGIAHSALQMLTAALIQRDDVNSIELLVMTGNVASERVAEKAGYTRRAVLPGAREIKNVRRDMTLFVHERGT
jgi:RimJ/RimL family protein N-acetyltransferase